VALPSGTASSSLPSPLRESINPVTSPRVQPSATLEERGERGRNGISETEGL